METGHEEGLEEEREESVAGFCGGIERGGRDNERQLRSTTWRGRRWNFYQVKEMMRWVLVSAIRIKV